MLDAVVRLLTGDGEATAFAVHPDGWFLTCDHSIAATDDVQIMLSHGRQEVYDAEVVLRRPETDVAVLRARAGGPFVSLEVADVVETGRHAQLLSHFTLDRLTKMSSWAPTGYRSVEVWWVLPSLVEVLATPVEDEGRALVLYHSPDHVESGCSGAPVVGIETRAVLGMHTSEFYRAMGLAVRANELNAILQSVGVTSRAWSGRAGKRTPADVIQRAKDRSDAEWLSVTYVVNTTIEQIDAEDAQKRLNYLAESGRDQLDYPSMHILLSYLYFGIGDFDKAYDSARTAFLRSGSPRAAYVLNRIARRGIRADEVLALLRGRIEATSPEASYASAVIQCEVAGQVLDLLWRMERNQEMAEVADSIAPYLDYGDRDMSVRCLRARALVGVGRNEEAVEIYDKVWADRADGVEPIDFATFAKALAVTGQEHRAVRLGLWACAWTSATRTLFLNAAQAAHALGLAQLQKDVRRASRRRPRGRRKRFRAQALTGWMARPCGPCLCM